MENSFEPRPEIDKIVLDNLSSLDGFLAIAYGNMPDEERGNIEVYAVFVEKGEPSGFIEESCSRAIKSCSSIIII